MLHSKNNATERSAAATEPQVRALGRRDFLRGLIAGSGLLIAARVGTEDLWAQDSATGLAEQVTWSPDLFLHIDVLGMITIIAHRSEMGTGIRTALPLVVADELDADLDKVVIKQAIGNDDYGDQNTDGSNSIRGSYGKMRRIGATARYMLEQAAADRWGVEKSTCTVKNHAIHHEDGRVLSFGELVQEAAKVKKPKRKEIVYKSPSEWRYVGKDTKIYDLHDLTVGKGIFAADVRPEGCLFAVIARCPVLGGVAKAVNDGAALKVPGVIKVFTLDSPKPPYVFKALGGVVVVANSTFAALQGRNALEIDWDMGPAGDNLKYDSVAYRKMIEENVLKPGKPMKPIGDVEAGLAAAAQVHKADYYLPHLSHAPMEPPAAVAIAGEDGCELWACVQNPQAAQSAVAEALGLKSKKVICNVTLLGGGFGRKSKPDFCVEAALVSREMKAPVKVFWTREDDLRHDYYHSVAATHLEAGIDAEGKLTAWLGRTACPPIGSTFQPGADHPTMELSGGQGFSSPPFATPARRIEACQAPAHVRIGWLRSVANVFHAFSVCSFADELALMQNKEPLEYLTGLVDNPEHRLVQVAKYCAEQAGPMEELPAGQARGFAMHNSFGSYVAVIATVAVSKNGQVTYPRIDIAIDCGLIISPDRVHAQMEGSVIFGISLLQTGSITAQDGAIVEGNFDAYPVARMSDTPTAIHVHLMPSEEKPGGVGEPGVPPVAPAICNAIARATGKRIRSLPLSDHDLSWS